MQMKNKIHLFIESLKLVWKSTPGWTLANTVMSVLRSVFPLLLIWLLKEVVDDITRATTPLSQNINLVWPIVALVVVWFLDEATSDFSSYVRKKQAMKLEIYMYGLLHSKAIRLDLINFERPEYFDCLTRASREAPWRPNSILNNLVSMLRGLLSLLLMAGLIFTLHWTLAVLLLVANIPGIWLRLYYADILYNFQKQQTPESRKSSYFNWLLTGDRPSRELRLFGLGNYFISLFKKSFLKQKEEEINITKRRMYIAHLTIGGKLTLGQMTMFLLAFRQGMVYIKDLFGSIAGLYEDSLFIGDTFEFLNLT